MKCPSMRTGIGVHLRKNADLDVLADFEIFNILDSQMRKMQIWMLQKILRFWTPHEKKMQIWMPQKI